MASMECDSKGSETINSPRSLLKSILWIRKSIEQGNCRKQNEVCASNRKQEKKLYNLDNDEHKSSIQTICLEPMWDKLSLLQISKSIRKRTECYKMQKKKLNKG